MATVHYHVKALLQPPGQHYPGWGFSIQPKPGLAHPAPILYRNPYSMSQALNSGEEKWLHIPDSGKFALAYHRLFLTGKPGIDVGSRY
jgi:hypothetical protein